MVINPKVAIDEVIEADDSLKKEIEDFFPKSDKGFWHYEYRGFLPEKSVFVVAKAGNKVVGTQAIMPYVLNVNGKSLLTGRSERTLLKKEFRGGTVFTRMMDLCSTLADLKGVNFIWGFTLTKKPFKREGFVFHEKYLEHSFYCISLSNALKCSFFNSKPYALLINFFLATCSQLVKNTIGYNSDANDHKKRLVITDKLQDDNDVNKLYHTIRGTSKFVFMEQNHTFQKWLVEDNNRNYLKYFAYQNDQLRAYMYIDYSTNESGVATIKDFASIDAFAAQMIIKKITNVLNSYNIGFLRAAYNIKNPVVCAMARQMYAQGFIPVRRSGGFVVRPLKYKDMNMLEDIKYWHITPIWSDLYVG